MRFSFLLALLAIVTCDSYSSIWVYNYPDTIVSDTVNGEHIRSDMYSVTISQSGENFNAFVMRDKNQADIKYNPHPSNKPDYMPDNTDFNHWTNFSFTDSVKITIKRTDGLAMESCKIFPSKKGYSASIKANTASFWVHDKDVPLSLFVEMNDSEENPLFIFCDPAETDIPNPDDKDVLLIKTGMSAKDVREAITNTDKPVIYFEKGLHKYRIFDKHMCNDDGTRCQDCRLTEGYNLPLLSNKTYYLPGGCYLQGSFSGPDVSNTTIKGRGIISGCGLSSIRSTKGIPYSLISFDGTGKNQVVDGIIVTNPPHFAIVSRGKILVNNVKIFGWWISSDGVVGGDGSTFNHNFFKVNDDVVKLYSDNNTLINNTIYQQVNGAPFQFSWSNQSGNNNTIIDTYIVYANDFIDSSMDIGNTAVINMVNLKSHKTYKNNKWDGIYIDNGVHRLLGIDAKGFGTFENWSFKNIEINSPKGVNPQFYNSYLLNGTFKNFVFTEFTINGEQVTHTSTRSDGEGAFWITGNVEGIKITQQ